MEEKSKVTYQDDDYGIEVFVKKDTPKQQPKQEEAKKETKPTPQTLDEDELYEERPKVVVGQKTQQPVVDKVVTKAEKTKHEPEQPDEDQFVVQQQVEAQEPLSWSAQKKELELVIAFKDEEFLVFDCKRQNWQLGDFNDTTVVVPEHAAVVALEPTQTVDFHMIAVGGLKFGRAQSSCLGIQFYLNMQNLVEYFSCNVVSTMPELRTARFMHQAALVKVGHAWTLFVAGGKTKDDWLNSTELLDLSPYFKKGLTVRDAEGIVKPLTTDWRQGAPMLAARANFALIAIKDQVYALGGIEGRDSNESHRPVLSHIVCERYSVGTDKWESINIANMSRLAAFAWTMLDDPTKIAILGGTNGGIMQDELMIVDFKAHSCDNVPVSYPFYTSMGFLAYRSEDKTLYSFGGINSAGINYKHTLDSKDWEQCDKRHSLIANAHAMELVEIGRAHV